MNENAPATDNSADPQAADVGTVGQQIESTTYPDGTGVTGVPPFPESSPKEDTRPVIKPTVGRKVWFFPNGASFHSCPYCIDEEVPMDADIVYVWGDRMVNLTVKDHIGQVHAFTSVQFLQPEDEIPVSGAYAMWMPYQIGQAKAAA